MKKYKFSFFNRPRLKDVLDDFFFENYDVKILYRPKFSRKSLVVSQANLCELDRFLNENPDLLVNNISVGSETAYLVCRCGRQK